MLNSGDNSAIKAQTRCALPAERANNKHFFIVTDNKGNVQKCYTCHTAVLFPERRLARETPWLRLPTSPASCNSSFQVVVTTCPPHRPLLSVLQLKVALFCAEAGKKPYGFAFLFFIYAL